MEKIEKSQYLVGKQKDLQVYYFMSFCGRVFMYDEKHSRFGKRFLPELKCLHEFCKV